jgi:hypothetical protein
MKYMELLRETTKVLREMKALEAAAIAPTLKAKLLEHLSRRLIELDQIVATDGNVAPATAVTKPKP